MDRALTHYSCATCGTQFAATPAEPEHCPICEDERQYIGFQGQRWTTPEVLRREHRIEIKPVEPGLTGIGTTPALALGQRALLVQTSEGNVLWDCLGLIDEPTIAAVRALGGLRAIAISHPHFYGAMIDWAHAFDAPIYLHADERQWVMRPDPAVRFWEGETQTIGPGLTLIRCGGHFAGSQVLHWAGTADDQGAILAGDTINVVSDRRWVSFMYSYPNLIPLPGATVRRIADAVTAFPFARLYGPYWDRTLTADASAAVERSAQRYITAITVGHGT